jgi:hypothetical protein
MKADLSQLCDDNDWSEVRKYLFSDAAEEEKKSNVMYCIDDGWTCLLKACCYDKPDDIIKTMLDIGGKDLVMMTDTSNRTVLQSVCIIRTSYNIIKMLIDVGGKDLIMAKNNDGNTALHWLYPFIEGHTKAAEIIKLFLQIGDANLLLSAKNKAGQTPLEIATDQGASNIIKKLLTIQSTTTSAARSNNSPSTNIVPADNSTPITQSSQDHQTTRNSSTNNDRNIPRKRNQFYKARKGGGFLITQRYKARKGGSLITQSSQDHQTTRSSATNIDPNIPIRGLGIDQNHQSQLREAKEKAQTIQQDFDQKCIDYSDLEENYQSQLKEAKEQILQIQQDYDQKCADCCHLKEENQLENTEKLKLGSALNMKCKELYQCKRMKVDLENKVEAHGVEISLLVEQKEKGEKNNKSWKDKANNYMQICSEYKAKLQEMKDKTGAPVAAIQIIKQEEGEAARAQELLADSNRRAADLEAIVETQRSENAALSNEKDNIEKECMDKVDKLTRQLSKQQAELQLFKKSSTDGEGSMKRKHANEEHEEGEGTAIQSQTRSSKRRRAGNTRNALSDSLNTNQAEDDDAELKDMLMTRYLYTRQLQRANARIAQFEEEHDEKGS